MVKKHEIEISLKLPKINFSVIKRSSVGLRRACRRLLAKQRLVWSCVIGLALIGGCIGFWALHLQHAHEKALTQDAVLQGTSTVAQSPDFSTVLPDGKTIDKLGGWGRVSPPGSAAAYGYSDILGSVHIVVSEQQIPDNFNLANVAKQFGASQLVTASDGTAVYCGGSSTISEAITAKKGLLILLRSSGAVTNQQWLSYIASLQ